MKSASDRTSVASAAFGSLMDPDFLRKAFNDGNATFAADRAEPVSPMLSWLDFRTRVRAWGDWAFHRTLQ